MRLISNGQHSNYPVSKLRNYLYLVCLTVVFCLLVGCNKDPQTSAEEFLLGARKDTLDNNPFKAIIHAKNALQANSELMEARWLLAQNYLRLREGALAEGEIIRLREANFQEAGMDTAFLDALMQQGRYQDVINAGTSNLATPLAKTIVGEAHLGVSDLYVGSNQPKYQKGHVSLARSAFHQAIEADPELARPHLGLARIAVWEADFDLARTYLDAAQALDESDGSLWILRGIVQQSTNDFPAAESSYRKAVDLMPYDLLARMNLSRVLLEQRKLDEASELLDTMVREHPKMPVVGYLRAIAFLLSGERESAANVLNGVVQNFSSYIDAQFLLGRVLFDLGQYGQAEIALGVVVSQFPKHEKARKLWEKSKYAVSNKTPRTAKENQSAISDAELIGGTHLAVTDGELARRERDAENLSVSLVGQLETLNYRQKITAIESAIQRGDLAAAHAATFDIARVRPQDPEPLEMLGRIARMQRELAIARTYYGLALKKDKDYVPAIIGVAELDFQAQDMDLARTGFEKALSIEENNVLSLLGLARIDLVSKNYEAAEQKLNLVASLNPGSVNTLLVSAELAAATQNNVREQELLDEILSIDEESFNGNFLKARYLLGAGKPEEAESFIQKALQRFPQHIGALLLHVEILLQRGSLDAAQSLISEVAREFPQNTVVQRAYAATAYRAGKVALARELLDKALLTAPDDVGLLDALMTIHYEQQNYQEAALVASTLIQQVPSHPKAYRVLGDAQLTLGQANRAYDSYRQALESSDTFDTAEGIYLFALETGHLSLIRNLFESWSVDHPSDTRTVLIMASDKQSTGEHQSAIEAYELVIKENPDDATALNDLAWLYHVTGRDEALSLAERAHSINPTSPNILDTLGWILTERGDYKRALPLLTEAAQKLPKVGDVQYHLAQALAKGRHFARAQHVLNSALQSENLDAREAAIRLLNELKEQEVLNEVNASSMNNP